MEKIKKTAKSILYYSRYYHLIRFWNELTHPGVKLIILVYHNISDGSEYQEGTNHPFKLRPVLTTKIFELHLQILKKSYQVNSLEEGVQRLKSGTERNEQLVAITFDDGYESFYTLAYPLLGKYDFPATVFLPTDFIGKGKIFWWDELNQIFSFLFTEDPPTSNLVPIIGKELTKAFILCRNNTKSKVKFLKSLEICFANLQDEEREERIENLKSLLLRGDFGELNHVKTLNWDQISWLSQRRITFGSHTHTHLNLKYASLQGFEKEIE